MAKTVRWGTIKKTLPGSSVKDSGHRFKLWFESALKTSDGKKKKQVQVHLLDIREHKFFITNVN